MGSPPPRESFYFRTIDSRRPRITWISHGQVWRGSEDRLHAPDVLDVEVAQVFRRYTARAVLPEARASAAIDLLQLMPVMRHPGRVLLPRVWALRENLTAYDAAYIALAEALDVPLLTCDRRLARAPGHDAEVWAV